MRWGHGADGVQLGRLTWCLGGQVGLHPQLLHSLPLPLPLLSPSSRAPCATAVPVSPWAAAGYPITSWAPLSVPSLTVAPAAVLASLEGRLREVNAEEVASVMWVLALRSKPLPPPTAKVSAR